MSHGISKMCGRFATATIATLAVCAAFSAARAQSDAADDYDQNSKLYVSVAGGLNWHNPEDWTNSATYGRFGSKTGWAVIGAIGWKAANNIRLELEPGYRFNKQKYNNNGGAAGVTGGRTANESLMANVLFDIPTHWTVQPYVGGGVGVTRVRERLDSVDIGGVPVMIQGHNTTIAYQAIIGLGFHVSRNAIMTVDYRYFSAKDPDFTPGVGGKWRGENHNHAIMVGLRIPFSV